MPMGGGAMPGLGAMPGMGLPAAAGAMTGMPPAMGMPSASGNLDQSTKTLREVKKFHEPFFFDNLRAHALPSFPFRSPHTLN